MTKVLFTTRLKASKEVFKGKEWLLISSRRGEIVQHMEALTIGNHLPWRERSTLNRTVVIVGRCIQMLLRMGVTKDETCVTCGLTGDMSNLLHMSDYVNLSL